MSEIIKSAIVPYSAHDMRQLVNNVPAYPEFLKWCERGFILDSFATGYEAGMQVKIKGVRVEFSTINTLIDHSDFLAVAMTLSNGPFRKLHGYWRFTQLSEQGSKVQLELCYEIKSKLIGRMFARGFDQVASQLVSDFVSRAGNIYA